MVDNRSAGFFGIGGAFNFKSGDISGTAAKLSDDKMGQDAEYFQTRGGEEEMPVQNNQYMDQSAVLRATLNSLAMMNVANVINNKKKSILDDKEEERKNSEKERNALEEVLNLTSDEDFENNEYN